MTKLTERISKQIKEKKIEPKTKTFFILKRILIWSLIFLTLIFLGLVMSLNWEVISQQHLAMMMKGPKSFLMVMKAVPYFWVIISLLLSILVYYEFQKTKKGYKINILYIITGILGITLLLSLLFFLINVSEKIQHEIKESLRPLHRVIPIPEKHWQQPENGLLSGSIKEAKEEQLLLEDWDDIQWVIIIEKETEVEDRNLLVPGQTIRIIGEQENEHLNIFAAWQIKSWHKKQGKGALNKKMK